MFIWTETKSMFAIKNNNDGRKKTDIAKPYKISDSKKFVPFISIEEQNVTYIVSLYICIKRENILFVHTNIKTIRGKICH